MEREAKRVRPASVSQERGKHRGTDRHSGGDCGARGTDVAVDGLADALCAGEEPVIAGAALGRIVVIARPAVLYVAHVRAAGVGHDEGVRGVAAARHAPVVVPRNTLQAGRDGADQDRGRALALRADNVWIRAAGDGAFC